MLRHHGRVHALLDAALGEQGHAEQLDAVAEVLGGLDVGLGDGLDALHVDLVEGDAGAEGEAGQQRKLVGGIEAADVEGRIGLGVALGLRFLEHVGEGAVLVLHLGQDVVAGAVEDAVDAADLVARQRLAQRLDDRDAASHRRLEIQGHAVLLGEPGQLHAVPREQGLVGGDHRLAGRQRRLHGGFGRAVVAADQLHEDVDGRIGRQLHRIVEPGHVVERDATVLAARAGADARHDDGAPERFGEAGAMRLHEAQQAAPHGAEAGNPQSQGLDHQCR